MSIKYISRFKKEIAAQLQNIMRVRRECRAYLSLRTLRELKLRHYSKERFCRIPSFQVASHSFIFQPPDASG